MTIEDDKKSEKKEGKEMKKIISVYIIFAFLLTSFTGCGKLKNVPGLSQPETSNEVGTSVQSDNSKQSKPTIKLPQTSEPSNTLNKDLNQDNALVPLKNSAASNITQQPDNSSKIETKDLTKKESWSEWTERNWGRLCGVEVAFVGAAFIVYGIYHYFKPTTPLRTPSRIPS
ncbi:hypothetical protein ATZ36_13880 [Candidatus Endomicrobiellum trichonymphae]|uniref:Uncharacterized protein n=1 Tax=Endomicrobium trichonymphae TaxID=1408204 RepID=A0A1E5IM84_ENDTX|nr:hypothetical protein ATZ36_13880 [Candidatus Endomicrobium trichonymphae]